MSENKTKVERIIHGDSLHVLREMEDNSVDSVVTDPPYGLSKEPDISEVLSKWLAGEEYDHSGLGFMGKSWDSFVPHPDIWREVFRVLKPGGLALVFAGTRTQDLMTISLRIAGFEVRDVIEWIYFSGFPKSHNVSKAFDRRAGEERKKIGERHDGVGSDSGEGRYNWNNGESKASRTIDITAPATDLARKYDGWGTNLKPAHEPIIVVRKPLHDGKKLTVVDCVEKYGTGAINVDASRIGNERLKAHTSGSNALMGGLKGGDDSAKGHVTEAREGRFPANCITLDSDEFYSKYFNVAPNISPQELSKKASKKDRNSDWRGGEIDVGERNNVHPTVKPIDLMAWLVRLVTPEGGVTLDPFAGSGSTLVAAKREGFGFIGVELTEEYIPIIEARTGVEAESEVASE